MAADDGYSYSYNPCSDFNEGTDCKTVAVNSF